MALKLGAKCLAVHDAACWSNAKWDAEPSRAQCATQLWHIPPASDTGMSQASTATPLVLSPLFGSRETRRYDFHWRDEPPPEPLRLAFTASTSKMPSDTAELELSQALTEE